MPMKPITHEDFTIETVRRIFNDTEFYAEALRYFAGGGVLFGVKEKDYTYPDGYVKLDEDERLAIALTKFARHAWRFVERYALYNMFDVAHNEDGKPFVLTIQNILDGVGMLEKSALFPSKALETMNTIAQEYVNRFPSAVGSFDKHIHCFGVTSRDTHKSVLGTFLLDFLTRFMTGDEALHEKGKKVFQEEFGLSGKDLLLEVPVPFIPTFKSVGVEGMLRFKPQHPLVVNSANQHTNVTEERKMYTTPYNRAHNYVLQTAFSYDEANALFNKRSAFVRPCPMHPRHGFLESRSIGVEYLQLYSMMSLLSPIHSYYYAAGELDDMPIMTADFVNSVNYALLTRYAIYDVSKFVKGTFAIEDFPFWRGAFGSHTFGSKLTEAVNSAYTDGVTVKSVQEVMYSSIQDIEEYITDLKRFLHETALYFEYEEDNDEFEAMWTDFFHTKSKYVADVLRRLIIADFLMGCLTFIVAFSEGDVVEWVNNITNELRAFETLEDEFEQVEEPFNLLIMPKLEGHYSGIVSLQDGVIEFAFGSNEGITAGNAKKYYGVNLVPEEDKPFMLEFVDGYVVQKRKVPKKPQNMQYRQVEVKKVLDVRPFKEFNDALGWERLIREHADEEGVVAFCEKLPRTSHFTTQCLEWGIPVVFGDEPPKVGKVIAFHSSKEVTQEFLRRIRLGILPKLIEEEKTLKKMYMFDLIPLHATSFLGRNEDEAYAEFEARLFSHALTRLVLGGAYAVAREARHAVSKYTHDVGALICEVSSHVVSKNTGDISRLIEFLSEDDEIDELLFVRNLAGHSYSIVDTLLRDVPERFRSPLFQKVFRWFEDFEMEFSGPSNRFDLHIEMFKLFNSLNVIGVPVSATGAKVFMQMNAFEKEGRVCLEFYRSHSIEQLQRLTAVSVVLNAIYYYNDGGGDTVYCGERWMDFGANIFAILTLLEVQPEKRDTEWWSRMVSLVHRALNAVHNGNASPVEKMISSYTTRNLDAAEYWTVADFFQPLINLLKKCDGEEALGFQEADGAISRQASEKIEAELNNEVGKDLSDRIVKTICPIEYTSMGYLRGRVERLFGDECAYGNKFHALAEFECGVDGCGEVTKTFGFVHPMASYLLGKPIWTYPIFYDYSCTGFYPLVALLLNSGMTFMRHFVWGEVYSSYSIYNCRPLSVMSYPEVAPLCDKHRGELFDIQKKAFETVEQLQYQHRERVVQEHRFSKMKAVFDYYRKCHGDFAGIILDEEDREAFKEILPISEIETFIRELEEDCFVQFPKDESLSTLEKVHLSYERIYAEEFLYAEPSLVENFGVEKKKVELVSTFLKRLRSGRFYNKVGLPKPKWVSSGDGKKLVIGYVEEYEQKGEDA